MVNRDAHELNRRSWNAATPAHNRHKGDQAAFLRAGGSTLFPEERELLGDVSGKRLVHLQCNSGQDTLSLARLGAEVWGVDISDAAIDFATKLSNESGIPGQFVRSDLFDWFRPTADFHLAFASYGTLGWLSDLDAYFGGVAGVLAPGGRYVVVDFHPTMWIFDGQWKVGWPYSSHGEALEDAGVSDYVARSEGGLGEVAAEAPPFENPHRTKVFSWSLADVLGAALRAGLGVERFEEYPYSNGCKVQEPMRRLPGNRWTVPEGMPELPLMYGLVMRKPHR